MAENLNIGTTIIAQTDVLLTLEITKTNRNEVESEKTYVYSYFRYNTAPANAARIPMKIKVFLNSRLLNT